MLLSFQCVNPADLLKTHITGVINLGMGGFHTYIDVNEYPHYPNLTLNVLLKALKKAAERNVSCVILIFSSPVTK
jgi:hypothetical protein